MANENEEKKPVWVNVKRFLRNNGFNDLVRFLTFSSFMYDLPDASNPNGICVLTEDGKPSESIWYMPAVGHYFFPITPLSDRLFFDANKIKWAKEAVENIISLDKDIPPAAILSHKKPNCDYWNRLEYWSIWELSFLMFGEEPDLTDYQFIELFCYPKDVIEKFTELIKRGFQAGEIAGFEKEGGEIQIYTRKGNLGAWLKKMGFVAPEELKDAIGENEITSSDVTEEEQAPLTGPERQELGILRQARGNWKASINATVYVMNEIIPKLKGNIKRQELYDSINKMYPELTYASIEIIWQALRDKGLTKGPGRDKKPK